MLRFLRIAQLAVIDTADVEFEPGMNVLTGETGAGKSILVGAVGLLLGGRASGDLVRTGEDAATVEALFESDGNEVLVRREVTAQGRSRAYVNGSLATAGALKDLASRLIELHGQHEHHTLLDPATHLGVLDAYGALTTLGSRTAAAFQALQTARGELARMRDAHHARSDRLDLVRFQLTELDRAALRPGEDDDLAAQRQVLANAERLQRLCTESYATLYERDDAILATLGQVWRRVGELATVDPQFQPYVDVRDGIKSQLEDLALFLRRYADGIEASPAKLQEVEERLALVERLKRKYGPGVADVRARREALRRELTDLESGDDRMAELEQQHDAARRVYLEAAGELSQARHRVTPIFAGRLEAVLGELAMPETRIEVRFGDPPSEPAWTGQGIDAAELFVSPNPGEDLRPLARIVSGGELSRIMLAIKTLTAGSRHGFSEDTDRPPGSSAPGLIFDEVDAGIGGRAADAVGRRLRGLGSAFQVLCITHLPHIAAYADAHFQIAKHVDGGRTRTTVRRLDETGRVEELSRMLAGEGITDAVRRSAHDMLAARAKAKGESSAAKGETAPIAAPPRRRKAR